MLISELNQMNGLRGTKCARRFMAGRAGRLSKGASARVSSALPALGHAPAMKPALPSLACIAFFIGAQFVWSARADYASTVLSYGPVAFWQLNETAASPPLYVITNSSTLGGALNGYGVDTNEVLAANHDTGIPVISGQPGIVGNCARLSNAGDDTAFCYSKIDVPWNAANNPNPPFTIEFWAKPNSVSADSTG